MSDLIEQLRKRALETPDEYHWHAALDERAAAALDRLRADNAALAEALEKLLHYHDPHFSGSTSDPKIIAWTDAKIALARHKAKPCPSISPSQYAAR